MHAGSGFPRIQPGSPDKKQQLVQVHLIASYKTLSLWNFFPTWSWSSRTPEIKKASAARSPPAMIRWRGFTRKLILQGYQSISLCWQNLEMSLRVACHVNSFKSIKWVVDGKNNWAKDWKWARISSINSPNSPPHLIHHWALLFETRVHDTFKKRDEDEDQQRVDNWHLIWLDGIRSDVTVHPGSLESPARSLKN